MIPSRSALPRKVVTTALAGAAALALLVAACELVVDPEAEVPVVVRIAPQLDPTLANTPSATRIVLFEYELRDANTEEILAFDEIPTDPESTVLYADFETVVTGATPGLYSGTVVLWGESEEIEWSGVFENVEVTSELEVTDVLVPVWRGEPSNSGVTGIQIAGDDEVEVGGTIDLEVEMTGFPVGTPIWGSDDPEIATVSHGTVLGVSVGEATITVAAGTAADTFLVEVVEGEDPGPGIVTWVNAEGGLWSDGENWSTGSVPDADDDAVIALSGTYTVTIDTDVTVKSLTFGVASGSQTLEHTSGVLTISDPSTIGPLGVYHLAGGTLTGSGILTVDGVMSWTGGTLGGPGTTRIGETGELFISGGVKNLTGPRVLENLGYVTWSEGQIASTNGAVVSNAFGGIVEFTGDVFMSSSGLLSRIDNDGTLLATGTGSVSLSPRLNNDGEILVNSGTFILGNDGTSSGSFVVQAGATLHFGGGGHVLAAGSSVEGDGNVNLSASPITVAGSFALGGRLTLIGGAADFDAAFPDTSFVGDLRLMGGTLGGTGALAVVDTLRWDGGVQTGTGSTTVLPTGTFHISGSGDFDLAGGRLLHTLGEGRWGAGNLRLGSGSIFRNSGDLLVDGGAANLEELEGSPGGSFENLGTLVVDASVGDLVFTVAVPFTSSGTVDVQAGTLQAVDDFDLTETAILQGSGRLDIADATSVTVAGTIRPGTSPGHLTIEGDLSLDETSTIEIEIGGYVPGTDHDLLSVDGFLDFDGTLSILMDGFTPVHLDAFPILTFEIWDGVFDVIHLPSVPGFTFDLITSEGATPDTLYVTATGGLPPIVIASWNLARGGEAGSLASGSEYESARAVLAQDFPDVGLLGVSELSAAALEGVDVLFLTAASTFEDAVTPLGASEQAALLDFVAGGACTIVFVESDQAPWSATNASLLSPFGMAALGAPGGAATASVNGPRRSPLTSYPYGIVESFTQNFPTSLAGLGDARVLAAGSHGTALAMIPADPAEGSGSVLVFTDQNTFMDEEFDSNSTLFGNAVAGCLRGLPEVPESGGEPDAIWLGDEDASWQNPANWTTGGVPTGTTDVFVPLFAGHLAQLDADAAVNSLEIEEVTAVSLAGHSLTISEDLSGALVGGTVVMDGSEARLRGLVPDLTVTGFVELAGTTVAVGDVNVAEEGWLSIADHEMTVSGTFTTLESGVLQMTGGDGGPGALLATNVEFAGGSTANWITSGIIYVSGDFLQSGGDPEAFHAGGTHEVQIIGTGPHTIGLDNSGIGFGLAASHFANLTLATTGTVTLGSDVSGHSDFTVLPGFQPTVAEGPGGAALLFGGLNVDGLTLQGVELTWDASGMAFPAEGSFTQFENVTFEGYQCFQDRLRIVHPGRDEPFPFVGLSFSQEDCHDGGVYVVAEDSQDDLVDLTIDMIAADPPEGSEGFDYAIGGVGNAAVNWPALPGLRVWTGVADADWDNPANWAGGVPDETSDVVVPFTFLNPSPVLGSDVIVDDITVEAGAVLDLNGHTLTAEGDVSAGGGITNGGVTMTGAEVFVKGLVPDLTILGVVALADFTVAESVLVAGPSGALWLAGHSLGSGTDFVTRDEGILVMADEGDFLTGENFDFGGGNTLGSLSAGTIVVSGDFLQTGGSPDAFHASGTHTVMLAGEGTQTLGLVNSGIGIGVPASHFANLRIETDGTVLLTSHVYGHTNLISSVGSTVTITGAGHRLAFGGLDVEAVTFDGTALEWNATPGFPSVGGTFEALRNVAFENGDECITSLTVIHPGGTFEFVGLEFSGCLDGNNYIHAVDSDSEDGTPLLIQLAVPDPPTIPEGDEANYVEEEGGAVVEWPKIE